MRSPPNTANPVSVTMNQARSITANYVVQYQLSLATTPAAVGTSAHQRGKRRRLVRLGRDRHPDADAERRQRQPARATTSATGASASPPTTLATSVSMTRTEEPDRQLRRPVPAQPGDRPGGGGHDAHLRGKRRRLVRLGRDRQPERRPERRQGSRRALPLPQLERCLDRHHPGHLGLDERCRRA